VSNKGFTDEDRIEALKASNTGMWRLESGEGVHPKFYGDRLMNELMGISEDTAPEDRFDIFMSRIHEDDMKLFMNYYNSLKEKDKAEVVYRYNHPTQGIIYVRCAGIKSSVENGMACYRGLHQNITDTVRIELETRKAITQQAEIYKTISMKLLDHAADAISLIDIKTGNFTWFYVSGEDVPDRPNLKNLMEQIGKAVPEEYRYEFIENSDYEKICQSIRCQRVYSFSTFVGSASEENLRRLAFWFYSMDNDENTMMSMFKDTTTDYLKEQKLAEALVMSKQANRAKTVFLNNMSHDMRTPMNAIIGFTDLAKKSINDHEKSLDYLDKIETSSKHLLDLINDVLDMSRIESGHIELNPEESSIKDIVEELSTILTNEAKNKGVELSIDIDGIKNETVICDRLRLKQILLNCASNAIKFTPAGGQVFLCAKEDTTPEAVVGAKNYIFSVKDTGIGMSPEFVTRIFEPFAREDRQVRSIQGTGLGMTICKNIVKLMGGTIEVQSVLGEGSEFTIRLSMKSVENSVAEDTSNNDIDVDRFAGKRILLAEDNELNTEIATLILTEVGFTVEHALDGAVCFDMLMKAPDDYYDLILMDIQMPNMNGYETTQTIRALDNTVKSSIPIIAMTANAFEEDKKRAKESGMNGHIAKPIDVPVLLQTINRICK